MKQRERERERETGMRTSISCVAVTDRQTTSLKIDAHWALHEKIETNI